MSLLLNMLSRLDITFLPRSRRLLISWLQSPSVVILEPRKIKSDTVSTVSPPISHEVMGPDAMIFVFWMLSFKPTFSLSSFTFIKRLFSSSSLSGVSYSFSNDRRGLLLTPGGFLRSSTRGLVTEPPRALRSPPSAAFVKWLEHPCPASPLKLVF